MNALRLNELFATPFSGVKAEQQRPAASAGSATEMASAAAASGAIVGSGRTIAAASAQGDSCEFGSSKYYALCGLGGILSCGITHTMVTPLDLVKCRLQVRSIYCTFDFTTSFV